jgi:hypothetical protein
VDDDPFNLIALEGMFHSFGILHIEKAFNGQLALNKLQELSDARCGLCNLSKLKVILIDG